MAILARESFAASTNSADYVSYGKFNSTNGAIITNQVFGDNALSQPGNSYFVLITPNITTFIMSWRLKMVEGPVNNLAHFNFADSVSNTQFSISFYPYSGTIYAYRGNYSTGTLLAASPSNSFLNDTWFFLSCKQQLTL